MILYVNGDSHSEGHDAIERGPNLTASYGYKLAQKLGAEFVCDATAGCSNEHILKTTKKYLETNTPDFLIIGWTTWEREEWEYEGKQYQITSSGYDRIPKPLRERYKEFIINWGNPEVQWASEKKWHKKIYEFHLELKSLKIPHLFFNAFNYFFYIEHHNWEKYNWEGNYVGPYSNKENYYTWCADKGFQPKTKKYYHLGEDAHEAWAKFLLPKIKSIIDSN